MSALEALCFEAFSDDESGQRAAHPAVTLRAKMLAKVPPKGNIKPLPCPVCRMW